MVKVSSRMIVCELPSVDLYDVDRSIEISPSSIEVKQLSIEISPLSIQFSPACKKIVYSLLKLTHPLGK